MASESPANGEASAAATTETPCQVGRNKRASALQADKAWRCQPPEATKQPPAPKAKKAKLDPSRVHPKAYTDMPTLRKLAKKYSAEQIEWCNRRFPLALRELGWQVLPEDAGSNYSSYGEAHYMYTFAGQGIAKRGKHTLPYFSSRDDALAWWEQRLHDQARADSSAPLVALQRLKPLVRDANGVIIEAGGEHLQLQSSNTRKATGYMGVTEKFEAIGGKRTSVFVAKAMGEYLGTFGTAAEAARAYSQHLRSQAQQPAIAIAQPPAAAPPSLGPAVPKRKAPAAKAQAKGAAPLAATAGSTASAPAAQAVAPAPALAAAPAPAAAPDTPTMHYAADARDALLAARPNELTPEGDGELSEDGGADEDAGWDAGGGDDGMPGLSETQKELALRLRLSNAAASDPSRPAKRMRPPPLPQHLEMKATKPEPKPKLQPGDTGGTAGDWEGASMLEDIRRRAAELSGYGYREADAADFEEAHVVFAAAADDDDDGTTDSVAAVETSLSPSAVAPSAR